MNNPKNPNRRQFLNATAIGAAACGAVGVAYSLKRGLRYPTLGLEPHPLPTELHFPESSTHVVSEDIIQLNTKHGVDIALRAFSPEPVIQVRSEKASRLTMTINNVSPEAELRVINQNTQIKESTSGINRELSLTLAPNESVELSWKLPYENDFTFAAIGDSGGNKELAWCIERAHQLGAKFLLHLGDFNYQDGDYERAVKLFSDSPIPCFISIGNHDFHDNGSLYPQFLSELGPLNYAFTIGTTRFVNIDTAASIYPYSSGKRGRLIQKLAADDRPFSDTVAFTHKPLHDPLEGSTHDIGSTGERNWLISALKNIGSKTLLSGHIHIYDRSNFMGIDNIIAGQGLGHQDILTSSDYSKIILAEVGKDGKVNYQSEPLSLPMGLHCHPRSQSAKDALLESSDSQENKALLQHIDLSCTQNS